MRFKLSTLMVIVTDCTGSYVKMTPYKDVLIIPDLPLSAETTKIPMGLDLSC
jgi:predicted naringenin-chalcone synthase